jgi:hypothetical protein
MLEDVERIVARRIPVRFYGRMGGVVPLPDDILPILREMQGDVENEIAQPQPAFA